MSATDCEGCGAMAVTYDLTGVLLCGPCADDLEASRKIKAAGPVIAQVGLREIMVTSGPTEGKTMSEEILFWPPRPDELTGKGITRKEAVSKWLGALLKHGHQHRFELQVACGFPYAKELLGRMDAAGWIVMQEHGDAVQAVFTDEAGDAEDAIAAFLGTDATD